MKYPNLRYGNPNEFAYYIQGMAIKEVAKHLRRSPRCIQNWLQGRTKLPWYIPEILRLQRMEYELRMQQMNVTPIRARLGLVDAEIFNFPAPKQQAAPEPAQEAAAVVNLPRFY